MSETGCEDAPRLESTILRFVRGSTGLGEPGKYQFDALYIDEDAAEEGGRHTIRFRYVFDEDNASQYDKTVAFSGYVTIGPEEQIASSHLKLEHVGIAAHFRPPAGLVEERKTDVLLRSQSETADGIGQIAQILARAFFDDPFYCYVMPSAAARPDRLIWWMSCMIRCGLRDGRVYTAAQPVAGAAVWLGPDAPMISTTGIARAGLLAAPLRIGVRGSLRALRTAGEWEHWHKREPARHWYLAVLGVDPASQRRGIGSVLLRPVLDEADRDRLTCCLETAIAGNVSFYKQLGFSVITEGQFGLGLPYWAMRRSPC